MRLIYRTIKAFPLGYGASIEADWPWQETTGEYLRVIREGEELGHELEVS